LSTTQMAVIFCETSNPTKWVIDQPPTARITGRHRPDRGTIGGSRADRDYRMSTLFAMPARSGLFGSRVAWGLFCQGARLNPQLADYGDPASDTLLGCDLLGVASIRLGERASGLSPAC
jgi:hypothetical protein